ncbi:MAG: glucosylceramidase [Oleiphilaceae bacterium]|jgi:glucosylceramidase
MSTNAQYSDVDYKLGMSSSILLTSEDGDKLSTRDNVVFETGYAQDEVIHVWPDKVKQTLLGIGSSFTESSAFVLAHLDVSARAQVMENIYGAGGANFSLARTPIGACDFSVEGRYSYDDVVDDKALDAFSIDADKDGFSKKLFTGIQDQSFDLLPMIKQALEIKQSQQDQDLRILASAWTAPAWMKDIEDWYVRGTPENNHAGTGGELKTEYIETYARYLVKYLDAYAQEGVCIWGLTPVNEPMGNNGQWESMNFSAESENDFVKNHLGPSLHASGHEQVKILVFDHNRDELEHWADTIFADPESASYVYGAAIHWYESTFKVSEELLELVHQKYPEFSIIHSEGCIDDLGKDAPDGILDPARFKEADWFANDSFWWNDNATDWAYTATWPGVIAEDHPIYAPVHRYARNIIESFNHWVTGWIDWNIVLDRHGGPNHVGNFCGAPIMIDTDSGEVYYTPIFHVLAQLSRTIRPNDKALQTDCRFSGLDGVIYSSASIGEDKLLSVQVLNTSKQAVHYHLQIGVQNTPVCIAANSLQTVQVQL